MSRARLTFALVNLALVAALAGEFNFGSGWFDGS